jgi:hypothetical protein
MSRISLLVMLMVAEHVILLLRCCCPCGALCLWPALGDGGENETTPMHIDEETDGED